MSSTGVMPIPCPHFKITIVKRSQGQSAVAGTATAHISIAAASAPANTFFNLIVTHFYLYF